MRCGQLTSILHVTPQIPELLQANFRDVNNVVRLVNGSLWIRSTRCSCAEGHDKASEIFVQRKEPEHP